MTRSTLYRSIFTKVLVGAFAAAVLAFAPSAALAQHGGGGGHMGGGGGGGHVSSGGFGSSHASAPASHSTAKPAPRSAPVTNSRPPVSTSAHPIATSANSTSATTTGTAGGVNPRQSFFSAPAAPRTSVIGFPPTAAHPFESAPFRPGALSFSGQGHQIWQDSPSASSTSSRGSLAQSQAKAVANPPHRIFFGGPGVPVFFFPAFGFFGNGFGCDPFWGWNFDPNFGCNGFGYGFGYGFGGGYGGYYGGGYGYNFGPGYDTSNPSSNDSGNNASDGYGVYDNPSADAAQPSLQQNQNDAGDATSSDAAPAPAPAAVAAPPFTVIYLKDGTSYEVMSYWLDAGQLHYVTNYGGETSIPMNQVDLQRTVDENAQHGATFTLRPATPAAPDAPPADAPSQQ
jgi:hypothetical protein